MSASPEQTTILRQLLEEMIPFNHHLGLKLESIDLSIPRLSTYLKMRPEFIGNPIRQMPHGGLISAIIDATAGGAAAISLGDLSIIEHVTTVDMRVDYLKPARGDVLFTHATVMRSGKRTIFIRSEVMDNENNLVALGTNVFSVVR